MLDELDESRPDHGFSAEELHRERTDVLVKI
jgi:hypothetical protein